MDQPVYVQREMHSQKYIVIGRYLILVSFFDEITEKYHR